MSIIYRPKAIECYQKLGHLMEHSIYDESFVFDKEIIKILHGKWKVMEEPETILSFFEDDKRFYFKDNIDFERHEIFWLAPNKILADNLYYGTLVKEGNEYIIKLNYVVLKKVD